jgi:NADH-quinone oxidoreductase subunit C
VPDEHALELIAQELREADPESVLGTVLFRNQATLEVNPASVRMAIEHLGARGYTSLASLHGCDYFPEEPRLGVHYVMLDMSRVDRVTIKTRVTIAEPTLASVVDMFPGADFPEREVYDMFGVVFDGHPDLRRILMPEDYEGFPQRRDFPVGGEPVLFTYNEVQSYGKFQ